MISGEVCDVDCVTEKFFAEVHVLVRSGVGETFTIGEFKLAVKDPLATRYGIHV